jgi:F5/8 type C domain
MKQPNLPTLRKRLMAPSAPRPDSVRAIDLGARASIVYSSEDPAHPIENIMDDHSGPGSTFWSSERVDTVEQLLIEFDAPQPISRLVYEVEEIRSARTQEVRIEVSDDDGRTYRGVLAQEYTFSPQGSTFQREDFSLQATAVTQLRLTIRPNKGGTGKATLTSLRLYG